MKYCNFATFNRIVETKTSILVLSEEVKYLKRWTENDNVFLISQNTLADLKGPKG